MEEGKREKGREEWREMEEGQRERKRRKLAIASERERERVGKRRDRRKGMKSQVENEQKTEVSLRI